MGVVEIEHVYTTRYKRALCCAFARAKNDLRCHLANRRLISSNTLWNWNCECDCNCAPTMRNLTWTDFVACPISSSERSRASPEPRVENQNETDAIYRREAWAQVEGGRERGSATTNSSQPASRPLAATHKFGK